MKKIEKKFIFELIPIEQAFSNPNYNGNYVFMVENDQDKLDWIYALFDFTFEGMKKVYGIPIKEILLREGRNDIPFVVEHLISFLEKK